MSLRVAVWCPQGRETLPLAAALCRQQLPAELIVWSSDEPSAHEPKGVSADLWLVLCDGHPPAPPPWRERVAGRWAVFPGDAGAWTDSTREMTEAWGPDVVLTDLLPDEVDTAAWFAWWEQREFAWLPAHGESGTCRPPRHPFAIAVSAEFPDWLTGPVIAALSEALGGKVVPIPAAAAPAVRVIGDLVATTEAILWCTTDPVRAGLAMSLAAGSNRPVLIWGDAGSCVRGQWSTDGTIFCEPLPDGTDGIGPSLRRVLRTVRKGLSARTALRTTEVLGWEDWLHWIIAPKETKPEQPSAAGALGAFACLRDARQSRDIALRAGKLGVWREIRRAVPSAIEPIALEALFQKIVTLPPTVRLSELAELLDQVVPQWWTKAGTLCDAGVAGRIGCALFNGSCDAHVFGGRRERVVAAALLVDRAASAEPSSAEWRLYAGIMHALSGDLERASEAIEWLQNELPSQVMWLLNSVLRGWLPELEGTVGCLIPEDGRAWWLRAADRAAEIDPANWLHGARAAALFGDADGAEKRFVRSLAPAVALAPVVVGLAISGFESVGRRWWQNHRTEIPGNSPESLFWIVAAHALCAGATPSIRLLAGLDAAAPSWFDRSWPTDPRAFVRALVHQRLGDEPGAIEWLNRARVIDSLAPLRTRAWERLTANSS